MLSKTGSKIGNFMVYAVSQISCIKDICTSNLVHRASENSLQSDLNIPAIDGKCDSINQD